MAQTVTNLCISRKVFQEHQVNWNTVCGAIRDLPWRNIWLADNPVEVLNEHLSLLVGRYEPTKVIRKKTLTLFLKPAGPTPSNTGSTISFHRDNEMGIKVRRYLEILQQGGA